MENASKALLIGASILIAILVLTILVTLFRGAANFSKAYDKTAKTENVSIFNSNFNKYLGQNLTIYQVVTITNYAKSNGVEITSGGKEANNISDTTKGEKYELEIKGYDSNGYVSKIGITKK